MNRFDRIGRQGRQPSGRGKKGKEEERKMRGKGRRAGGKRRVAYYARQVTRVPREYKVMGRAPRTAL